MQTNDHYRGCWNITVTNQSSGISYFEITNETWYKNNVEQTQLPSMSHNDDVSFEVSLDSNQNFGDLQLTELKVSFLKGEHKPFAKWALEAQGSSGAATLATAPAVIKLHPHPGQAYKCAFDVEAVLSTPLPSNPATTTQNFIRVLLDPVIIVSDRPPEGG